MTGTQVVVLGGPSGAGKSRLAARLHQRHGWPVVRLDDFYKDGDDPTLPMTDLGIPDWDHVDSYRLQDAVQALDTLCAAGEVQVPTYDIATSRRTGSQVLRTDGAPVVLAEGIFATEFIAPLTDRGLLRMALCVWQGQWVTFARRLVRDLKERRKPPLVLVRRGLRLRAGDTAKVQQMLAAGALGVRPKDAELLLSAGTSAPASGGHGS
ncbi:uridine kinase family protein [Dermacoccaceae bacterium W4C1]